MKEIDGRDGLERRSIRNLCVCTVPIAAVMTIGWLSDALR